MTREFTRPLHYALATVAGSGFFPKAPGTAGSLVAVLFFWFVPLSLQVWLALLFALFLVGVWSAGKVELYEGKDPGKVVIDEFVGQGIALLAIPHQWHYFAAGFLLFRIFDIFKPFNCTFFPAILDKLFARSNSGTPHRLPSACPFSGNPNGFGSLSFENPALHQFLDLLSPLNPLKQPIATSN